MTAFEERRRHLSHLSDQDLTDRFWELADEIVAPLVAMARTHTSPSIERSVLLRMGFNSIEARELVDRCLNARLLGKGAGNIVWRWAERRGLSTEDSGRELMALDDWAQVHELFEGEGGKS